jgi:hypothetical protein
VRILDATKMVVRFPIPMLSFVKEFRVGADRCGCIVYVPMPPGVTKILFAVRFGCRETSS